MVIINGTSIAAIEPYFEGTTLNKNQKEEMMSLLFKTFGVKDFYDIQKKVEEAITSLYPFTKPCTKREWKSCDGTCQTILSDLIQKEIGSTAYMVRSLFRSVLWANKKKGDPVPIKLSFNGPLTGEWQKDIAVIKMTFDHPNPNGRLIMGFGPSAAGKTYWAQTLINLFSKVEGFPNTFLSIDGGLYRETSMIYQMIIRTLMRTCTVGFENLVGSTVGVKSLFKASDVKDAMMSFLLTHQPVSLYVPETLGSCGWKALTALGTTESCLDKYKEYIDLTGDQEWIGLHIWQHESGENCTYPELQKCKGCSESGRSREVLEGKKYSSSAYGHSIAKSNKHMKEARGGQFNIHNAGGRKTGNQFNKTTIFDSSENRAQNPFSQILAKNADQFNYIYSTEPVKQ
jgi:hypothetical protein